MFQTILLETEATTMTELLTDIGSFLTQATSWITTVAGWITATEFLKLMVIIVPLSGIGIGYIKRLIRVN